MWLCSVHNRINERLGKPEFDCLTLNDVYDCGCGPEGDGAEGAKEGKAEAISGKVLDKAGEAKEAVLDVKEKTKEKVKQVAQAVKGKVKDGANAVKETVEDVKADITTDPNSKSKPNRPLGGMNAKEKAGDLIAAADKAKAVAADKAKAIGVAAAGMAAEVAPEKDRPAMEKEEIVYNPPQRVKGAAKGKGAEQAESSEPEEEIAGEEEDELEGGEGDGEDDDLEAGGQVVLTELSAEDEEAEEDDSGEIEDAAGDGLDDDVGGVMEE